MRFRVLLAAAAASVSTIAYAAPPNPADQAALEALATANDAAWNAADAATISGQYTEDSSLRLSSMEAALVGREAVRGYFDTAFAQRPAGFRHVTRLQRIDMIAPDLAFADAHVRVKRKQGGVWELAREFVNHSVLRRENGAWRLQAVRAHRLSR